MGKRKDAMIKGEKTYISDKPCKCGCFEKYTSSYSCVDCSIQRGLEKLNDPILMAPYRTKEKQNEKLRKWRKNNPPTEEQRLSRNTNRREHYHNNKKKWKGNILKYLYNIDIDTYDKMLAEQNEVCAICCEPCSTGKSLAVDHDHDTGNVRGLLCKNCNIGIGLLKTSKNIEKALDYIRKYE